MKQIEINKNPQKETNTEIITRLLAPGRYMDVTIYKNPDMWTARMSLMPRLNRIHVPGESRALFLNGLNLLHDTATQTHRPIKFIAQTRYVTLIEMLKHLEITGQIQLDSPIHRNPQGMHIATITVPSK